MVWLRAILGIAALLLAGAVAYFGFQHLQDVKTTQARRTLDARLANLSARGLAPGSPLACLEGAAGEAIETACEKSVFAKPETAAAAVAWTTLRLDLLGDATDFAQRVDAGYERKLTGLRRAMELDRYGIAAHVMATRDGCTPDRCAAFTFLRDSGVIKSNMRTDVFRQYVGRYAGSWEQQQVAPASPPLAATPVPGEPAAPVAAVKPPGANVDFPTSASIPPVSIMNAEPKLPEGEQQTAPPPAAAPKRTAPTAGQPAR